MVSKTDGQGGREKDRLVAWGEAVDVKSVVGLASRQVLTVVLYRDRVSHSVSMRAGRCSTVNANCDNSAFHCWSL